MDLKITLRIGMALFVLGSTVFYWLMGFQNAAWFALGGALALFNVFVAAWSVRFGLSSLKKSATFVALLMIKSLSFLAVIAVVLIFLKPLLLPFTLGITTVIVSSVIAALWELRRKKYECRT